MRARADSDALAVDHGCDVMRMRALHLERDYRSLAASRADQTQRIDLTQSSLRVAQQIVLVRGNALLADRTDVVDCRGQTDRLDDRGRPGLELVRRVAIGDPVPGHLADHLAATVVRS